MSDNEMLKKMIGDYEEIVKNVSSKLDELKKVALERGLVLDAPESNKMDLFKSKMPNLQSNIAAEMEKKRQEIMENMQKVKEDAQAQAKKAMENAKSSASVMSSIPVIPNMMPPDLKDPKLMTKEEEKKE